MSATILLVGCGKMGSALLAGWLDRGVPASAVTVVEPGLSAVSVGLREAGATFLPSSEALAPALRPDVVVFAVKPQAMAEVIPAYRRLAAAGPVFLSIAAGRTIASYGPLLGPDAAVVRAMPNTPAAIRRGITVACAGDRVGARERELCGDLLAAVGEVVWVDDESLMDAVTAVSGSGPAYVFLLAEALAEAGVHAGLPADLAERLARTTVVGAGALLAGQPEPAAELRRNVTSPGGTTEAALELLLTPDSGLPTMLRSAVLAAAERSRKLAR